MIRKPALHNFGWCGLLLLGLGFLLWGGGSRPGGAQALAASAGDGPAAGAEVKIVNFSFVRPVLTVAAGTTVTWVNRDEMPHTVVASDGAFKSKALDTDEKFSYTFAKPGRYPYYCSMHPKMTGEVVVR
jgi:plastocyanin